MIVSKWTSSKLGMHFIQLLTFDHHYFQEFSHNYISHAFEEHFFQHKTLSYECQKVENLNFQCKPTTQRSKCNTRCQKVFWVCFFIISINPHEQTITLSGEAPSISVSAHKHTTTPTFKLQLMMILLSQTISNDTIYNDHMMMINELNIL